MPAKKSDLATLLPALSRWYAGEKHRYEFRAGRNAYRTWITEIFLQQTQINAGREKLKGFLHRFPDVKTLARGPESAVLAAFRGMGYYSRARNMYRAARYVVANHKGVMPVAYADLVRITGIGHYTAAIVASIHNDEKILALDANHARLLSRLAAIAHVPGTPAFKAAAQEAARPLFDGKMSPGDVNEALMQWGQTLCKKSPRCDLCFAATACAANQNDTQSAYPARKARPTAYDVAWVMLVHRRGNKYQVVEAGRSFPFLRGELMFPGFLSLPPDNRDFSAPESMPAALRRKTENAAHGLPVDFRHAITRYRIAVKLLVTRDGLPGGEYLPVSELAARCHSSLMQKALAKLDKLEF